MEQREGLSGPIRGRICLPMSLGALKYLLYLCFSKVGKSRLTSWFESNPSTGQVIMCSKYKGVWGTSDTYTLCEEVLSHHSQVIVSWLFPLSQIQLKTNRIFEKGRRDCSYFPAWVSNRDFFIFWLMKQELILNHLYTFARLELDFMER